MVAKVFFWLLRYEDYLRQGSAFVLHCRKFWEDSFLCITSYASCIAASYCVSAVVLAKRKKST